MPDPIQTLLAIEEIKKLKARYFRLMDTGDWANFGAVFTEDAIFDVYGALEEDPAPTDEPPIKGRAAILAYVQAGIDPIRSAHHGHMPEIDILSDTSARGIWPFQDVLRTPTGEPFTIFHGYGHYHETYSKADGVWRIASLKITRLLVEKA